ncbi:carbohydrate ABC transporter membrane protein 1, CUT1 family [Agreia bicolorata]|uniref:Carbohydrate ABC transporter membrane protein 1, CUT1 family n=2 Tax=Agreia bicolorata TaxID=110935 RepID=A0A1T4YBR9_9MICO|nr:sugar ABC transporter permease [Agreia bicolorata]SKA98968.1 carbohydrate ABC transporter membrane protein 1, CUT1 family [Agreia bicolorata]
MAVLRDEMHTKEAARGSRSPAGGGAQALPPAGAPPRARSRWPKRAELLLLIGPALVVFVAFVILPVALAAYYGFFSWSGYGPATDFVGLRNYITILTDPAFLEALSHNAFIVVMSLVLQGPLALGIALLLNRRLRFQSLIRVLIFVPYVISEVVVGLGWSLMLQSNGALNGLLEKVGLGGLATDWLSDPSAAIWTLLVIITWKYVGFAVILFLAGLQGIPDEITEAARIDGASYWQVQRYIVLPLMGPTVRIWAFLSIIGSLQLFDLVWIVWGQYVAGTAGTSTMATYMVANGRSSGSYGYGNAVAVVIFLISLVVALLYQRFILRRDSAVTTTGGAH